MCPQAVVSTERGAERSILNKANRKDAFTRREAAHEGMYIRAHEAEKLEALRMKLKEQRKQLDQLEQHVYVFSLVCLGIKRQRVEKSRVRRGANLNGGSHEVSSNKAQARN